MLVSKLLHFYHSNNEYFLSMVKTHGEKYYEPVMKLLRKQKFNWKKKKILEVGSGAGTFLSTLREQFGEDFEATGLDVSLLGRKFHKNVNFVEGNAEKLPFKNNIFDFVFSIDVLEHILNPQTALSEMYRVTKPGGYILIRTRNFRSPLTTSSFQSVFCYLRDLWVNRKNNLSSTQNIEPDLSIETLGGDKDAVSTIFTDYLRNSLLDLRGDLLVFKTWTKGGIWEFLNLLFITKDFGSMCVTLFRKEE